MGSLEKTMTGYLHEILPGFQQLLEGDVVFKKALQSMSNFVEKAIPDRKSADDKIIIYNFLMEHKIVRETSRNGEWHINKQLLPEIGSILKKGDLKLSTRLTDDEIHSIQTFLREECQRIGPKKCYPFSSTKRKYKHHKKNVGTREEKGTREGRTRRWRHLRL